MADSLNHDAEDRDVSACPAGVMPGAPLVEVERAFVTFPGMCALNDVSLVVRAGEHLAIRGGNGAGKSTLLRVVRGEQWLDQTRLAGGGVGSRGRVVWHTPTGAESSPLAGRNMSALVSAAVQEAIVRQGWNLSGEELVAGGFADTRSGAGSDHPLHGRPAWRGRSSLAARARPVAGTVAAPACGARAGAARASASA